MPELTRAADPVRGRGIYARTCRACHNTDRSGIAAASIAMLMACMPCSK
jgi:cytochrome c